MSPETKSILENIWPTYLHLPYRWGGSYPSVGLDCSGLVLHILQGVGVLPRKGFDATAQDLFNRWGNNYSAPSELGDLVFFGKGPREVSHVAFCLSASIMLEAGGGDSKVVSLDAAIEHQALVRLSPIYRARNDLLGFGRPDYP